VVAGRPDRLADHRVGHGRQFFLVGRFFGWRLQFRQ
jgi:hypothetical protein